MQTIHLYECFSGERCTNGTAIYTWHLQPSSDWLNTDEADFILPETFTLGRNEFYDLCIYHRNGKQVNLVSRGDIPALYDFDTKNMVRLERVA